MSNEIDFPCFIGYDECTGDYRISVGDMYSYLGDSYSADNYFDSADCGWGDYAGGIAYGKDLIVYVANFWAGDVSHAAHKCVYGKLEMWRKSGSVCSYDDDDYTYLGYAYSDWYTHSRTTGDDWRQAYADSKADCDGSYGDPGDFPLLDYLLTRPPGGGTYAYYHAITVGVCDYTQQQGCYNCSGSPWTWDSGCFYVDWE